MIFFLSKFINLCRQTVEPSYVIIFFGFFMRRTTTKSTRIFNPPREFIFKRDKTLLPCTVMHSPVLQMILCTLLVSVIILAYNIFLRSRSCSFKHFNLLRICIWRIWIKYRWEKKEESMYARCMSGCKTNGQKSIFRVKAI